MSKNRLETLKEMLDTDPKDSFVRYAIAKEYENLHDYHLALAEYLYIKEQDPDYVGLYYHLGKLFETLEEKEKAIIAYSDGIDVSKKLKDLHALAELNSAKMNLEMDM